jgi:hypothetical protein
MATVTELIPFSDLVFDMTLYPRLNVDQAHVARLADALRSGVSLPPIIIGDLGIRRNLGVDGFHRAHAYELARGRRALVPCERRKYKTAAELVLDAIQPNSEHGLPLSDDDRRQCVALARKYGIQIETLASVLSVTTAKVSSLRDTTAVAARSQNRPTAGRAHSFPGPKARSEDGVDTRDGIGGYDRLSVPSGLILINKLHRDLIDHEIDLRDSNVRGSLKKLAGLIVISLRGSEAA